MPPLPHYYTTKNSKKQYGNVNKITANYYYLVKDGDSRFQALRISSSGMIKMERNTIIINSFHDSGAARNSVPPK